MRGFDGLIVATGFALLTVVTSAPLVVAQPRGSISCAESEEAECDEPGITCRPNHDGPGQVQGEKGLGADDLADRDDDNAGGDDDVGPGIVRAVDLSVPGDDSLTQLAREEQACWDGVTDVCARLGDRFIEGIGVEVSEEAARNYYAHACGARPAPGPTQDLFGRDSERPDDPGSTVTNDNEAWSSVGNHHEAVPATSESLRACYRLGLMYASGWGVPTDREVAIAYAQRACAGGFELGCDLLNGLYELSF